MKWWREELFQRDTRKKNPSLRGKEENIFSGKQTDPVQKESFVVFPPRPCIGEPLRIARWKQKCKQLSPCPSIEKPIQWSTVERTIILSCAKIEGEECRADFKQSRRESCKKDQNSLQIWSDMQKTSCNCWHPPVCHHYKTESGCKYGRNCQFRQIDAEEAPSTKSRKESAEGSVASLKEKVHIGCVSQDSCPKKSILRKVGKLGSNASAGHKVKFSGGTWHQSKIRERKGPFRGIIPKCEPHERNPCAPRFEDRSHEETSREESWAREAAWNLAKTFISSKNKDKTTFYSPVEAKVPVFISTSPEERMFVAAQELLCTCWAKEVCVQQKWIRWDGPRPLHGGDRKWRSLNNRESTRIRTWSWSVRDCAITRRNASSSIAW